MAVYRYKLPYRETSPDRKLLLQAGECVTVTERECPFCRRLFPEAAPFSAVLERDV